MAKSGSLPKSLDFPTTRFLSGRKDLPLGRPRVQPAAARVVGRCMSRMRIRDRVVRVDQWLISSKASTFNSSTRRCSLVFRSSKRCAPASFFPAQSDAFSEQISTVVLLTFGLAFLALASRMIGRNDFFKDTTKSLLVNLFTSSFSESSSPFFNLLNNLFQLYLHSKTLSSTLLSQEVILEVIPEAILDLYSRLLITVTFLVVLARDFRRQTTDNHQLD